MSIVITTPTGHIGSKLAEKLLDAGAEVTLLARNPEKVATFAARGAKVLQGSLEDEAFVVAATRGASALFWLTPPNFQTTDFRAYQRRLGAIAARAIAANDIPRVVHLSSVGAQLGWGVGPVNGLHDIEKAINAVASNVTHLRPGAFMENALMSIETLKTAGATFLPVPGDARVPMVATRDIAAAAAAILLDHGWSGVRSVMLYGPVELSYNDLTAILTRELGKPVNHVQVTPGQAREAMLGMGLTPDMVSQYLELYEAFGNGRIVQGLPVEPDLRGATTFDEFARTALKPLLG
ncbi:MAG: NmrA family NAD(P)-binding protein [Thermoanaerobaculaceae bacterium]|nr:NmrA family NAD(P)-binding protein [Thermoanaerobaculaceae bacterium]